MTWENRIDLHIWTKTIINRVGNFRIRDEESSGKTVEQTQMITMNDNQINTGKMWFKKFHHPEHFVVVEICFTLDGRFEAGRKIYSNVSDKADHEFETVAIKFNKVIYAVMSSFINKIQQHNYDSPLEQSEDYTISLATDNVMYYVADDLNEAFADEGREELVLGQRTLDKNYGMPLF